MNGYPVRFPVDYPGRRLNRLTSAVRIFTAIPRGCAFILVTDEYPPFRLAP